MAQTVTSLWLTVIGLTPVSHSLNQLICRLLWLTTIGPTPVSHCISFFFICIHCNFQTLYRSSYCDRLIILLEDNKMSANNITSIIPPIRSSKSLSPAEINIRVDLLENNIKMEKETSDINQIINLPDNKFMR